MRQSDYRMATTDHISDARDALVRVLYAAAYTLTVEREYGDDHDIMAVCYAETDIEIAYEALVTIDKSRHDADRERENAWRVANERVHGI